MGSNFTVDIKITRDYLREFAYGIWNEGDKDFIYASEGLDIGKLIKSLLCKTPSNYFPPADKSEYITFVLPHYSDLNVKVYNYIKLHSQSFIELYLNSLLNLRMRSFLMDAYNKKIERKNSLYVFMEINNISITDKNYERMIKNYKRWEKTQKCEQLHQTLKILDSVKS